MQIEFDIQPRDRYGSLLPYVCLSDGRMLNEEIVRAGHAGPMTIPPDVKHQDRFLRGCREAGKQRKRLWQGIDVRDVLAPWSMRPLRRLL